MTGITNKEQYNYISSKRFEGKSYEFIGKYLNVTKQAVQNYCKRYDINKTKSIKSKETYNQKKERVLKENVTTTEQGCWEYNGFKDKSGYSKITYRSKTTYGHRLSYILFKGEVPVGMCVCHTCDNRKCVNPDHLWLGTHQENIQDREIKKKVSTKL